VFKSSTPTHAIVDSFYTVIDLPTNDFLAFATYMTTKFSYITCDLEQGFCYYLNYCGYHTDELPPLRIQFGDLNEFSIPNSLYVEDAFDSDNNERYCRLLVQSTTASYYTVGQVFLYNYYSIYDFE
jgi:hypothetical protein